ncbi:uncharacterized protein MCYG_07506 [Microsporum canis CBS 113480]|uniref:Uncharacterized protein n=1 Tax=Arthroderma otae (strain ATCC MYA-4605 / CBS 113480) TaxID=554155 RepID=C5FYT9_ARTOC|nr:uncharacterized protein MCYG_07506 [Microsporum canis CBS 113480]EEQ34687.1 predicted protein [Microsporum canis CBS 113480]
MHVLHLIVLFLLQLRLSSAENYQYIPPGVYTINDNSTGQFATVGTTPVDGIVEFKSNTNYKWRVWGTGFTLAYSFHTIQDQSSKKYIHFPEIKDGAIAVLNDNPSLVRVSEYPHNSCNLFSIDASNRRLYWTTEKYSNDNPIPVLKLRASIPKSKRYTVIRQQDG